MLSGVLRSKTAVAVNIRIMRAFVELRRVAASYTAIERQVLPSRSGLVSTDAMAKMTTENSP